MDARLTETALQALPYIGEYIGAKGKALAGMTGFDRNSREPFNIIEGYERVWLCAERIRRLKFLRAVMYGFVNGLKRQDREYIRLRYYAKLPHEKIDEIKGRAKSWSLRRSEAMVRLFCSAMLKAGITENVFLDWFDGEALFTYWME